MFLAIRTLQIHPVIKISTHFQNGCHFYVLQLKTDLSSIRQSVTTFFIQAILSKDQCNDDAVTITFTFNFDNDNAP